MNYGTRTGFPLHRGERRNGINPWSTKVTTCGSLCRMKGRTHAVLFYAGNSLSPVEDKAELCVVIQWKNFFLFLNIFYDTTTDCKGGVFFDCVLIMVKV